MARRRLLVSLSAAAVVASIAAAGSPGAAAKPKASPPDKVVVIVVDALSKEIVEKYHMKNVEKLMAQGVDTPNGYLGHTGSVTVVTHNVVTTGMQPKHMGWTNEGYRDVDGLLGAKGGLWLTSNFGSAQMTPLQKAAGAPHLSDYLDDTGKVFTVSPKAYAAYGLSGPGSAKTSVITFGSKTARCPAAPPARRSGAAHPPASTCRRTSPPSAARATSWPATRSTTPASCRPRSTPPPTTATSSAPTRPTRAGTSGRPTRCSTSWATRRTPGAASS